MQSGIEQLKAALPNLVQAIPNLTRKTDSEMAGPCPKCGGKDRFIVYTKEERFWCRKCAWSGDVIDYHCWKDGLSLKDLIKKYTPGNTQKSNDGKLTPSEVAALWSEYSEDSKHEIIYAYLSGKRKVGRRTVEDMIHRGNVCAFEYSLSSNVANTYGYPDICTPVVSILYRRFDGNNEPTAIQHISTTGKPLFESDDSVKIFEKGSAAKSGFFHCGADLETAEKVVLVEAAVNAASVVDCAPDVCALAIGGATLTSKVEQLKRFKGKKKFICFFDHDDAGREAAKRVAKVLGSQVLAVQYPDDCEDGFDPNDLLKLGRQDTILSMLGSAVPVESKKTRVREEKKESQTKSVGMEGLPEIDITIQDTPAIASQAWEAINLAYDPHTFFQHLTGIVRIEKDEKNAPRIRTMKKEHMLHHLARVANWIKETQGGSVITRPPEWVAKDLLADPAPPLPLLLRVVPHPLFAPDGSLQLDKGYSPKTKYIYAPEEGFILPEIPLKPSSDDLLRAVKLFEDLICDFPFVNPAGKAHVAALFVLPYSRLLIPGPTPLLLIDAPSPGTGKTRLADVVTYPALGSWPSRTPEGQNEEEWRKRITAILLTGPDIVLIDNIILPLKSGSLSGALTGTGWSDRILGLSEMVNLSTSCIWIATANNPHLSLEILRRTIRTRLDSETERPWLRKPEDFAHPDIRAWVKQKRPELVWAALVIVQNWIARGCPEPKGVPTLGMFEEWSRVIGGILQTAGISGFLGNLEDFYETADSEGAELRRFVQLWWEKYRQEEVGVKQLYALIEDNELALNLKGDAERGRKTSLGRLVNTLRDRQFGNYRITPAGDRKRAQLWKLVPTHVRDAGASRPSQENETKTTSSETGRTETGYL